jgi:hypothetical protein
LTGHLVGLFPSDTLEVMITAKMPTLDLAGNERRDRRG